MSAVPFGAYLGIPSPHVVHEIRVHEDVTAGISSGLPLGAVGKKDTAHLHLYTAHVPPARAEILLFVLGRFHDQAACARHSFPCRVVNVWGRISKSDSIYHRQLEPRARDDLARLIGEPEHDVITMLQRNVSACHGHDDRTASGICHLSGTNSTGK